MKKFTILLLLCPLFATPALAQSFDLIDSDGSPLARGIHLYEQGKHKAALEILKPLSEDGNPKAQAIMAEAYEFGYGIDEDFPRAFDLYLSAAKLGDEASQMRLAEIILNLGQNFNENTTYHLPSAADDITIFFNDSIRAPNKAKTQMGRVVILFYRELGDEGGRLRERAQLFFGDYTVPESALTEADRAMAHTLAEEWRNGNLKSWATEALLADTREFPLRDGIPLLGCAKHLDKKGRHLIALELLKPPSEKENLEAQVSLGCAYEYGYGVAKNGGRALEIHLSAAKNGDKYAGTRLAQILLAYGNDFSPSPPAGSKSLYNDLLHKKDAELFYRMAYLEDDMKVQKYRILASFWYEVAVDAGHLKSRVRLFFRGYRLPETDQAIAHALAQEWINGKLKAWIADALPPSRPISSDSRSGKSQNSGEIGLCLRRWSLFWAIFCTGF